MAIQSRAPPAALCRPTRSTLRFLATAAWLCALAQAANATLALGAAACTDRASCDGHGDCTNGACACDAGWSGDTCAVAVPTPPPTPPPDGHDKAREGLHYLLLVLLPFLGRAIESHITNKLKERCCKRVFGSSLREGEEGKGMNPLDKVFLSGATGGKADKLGLFDMAFGGPGGDGAADQLSWDEAVKALGYEPCMGRAVGALRLVFWHWMQPAMYAVTIYAYWDTIDSTQKKLGLVVAAREALYLLCTLVALWRKPIFLLVNLDVQKQQRLSYCQFVAMPHNFLLRCAMVGSTACQRVLPYVFLVAADLCGTAALVVGAMKGTLSVALAVGYSVATLGWVALVLTGLGDCPMHLRECWKFVSGDPTYYQGHHGTPPGAAVRGMPRLECD
jgi:hypothetical protein